MKKLLLITLLCIIAISLNAQQDKGSIVSTASKTKFESFIAQGGSIICFEDYNEASFSTLSSNLFARKRIVKKGDEQKVFLVFEIPSNLLFRTAAIAEEDFTALFKAMDVLQSDASIDVNSTSTYLEKFYTTEDHFRIGYIVANKQLKWYLDIDIRGSHSPFVIKNIEVFLSKIKTIVK